MHVVLIGHDEYTPNQHESLARLRKWVSGSIRPSNWPKHMWLSELDWRPLQDYGCEIFYHKVNQVADFDVSSLNRGTIVDLFPGSKEYSFDLMVHMQQCETLSDSLAYKITQIDGNVLDISTGDVTAATRTLSITERIWLTAGKIARLGEKGNNSIGEKIKDWSHKRQGQKTVPLNKEKLANLLRLEGTMASFDDGFWLEHYASHVIGLWPDVVETWYQLHIIPSEWNSFPGVAMSKSAWGSQVDTEFIGYPYRDGYTDWPYGYDENGNRLKLDDGNKYIQWRTIDQIRFFEETEFTDAQVRHVWDYAYTMDVDVVALLKNGFFMLIECKTTSSTKSEHYERINAISATVAPRSNIPVLVQSSDETNLDEEQGILNIQWVDLKEPLIGIEDSNNRTIAFFQKKSPLKQRNPRDQEDLNRIRSVLMDLELSLQNNQHRKGIPWPAAKMIITRMFRKKRLKQLFGTDKVKIGHLEPYLSDFSLEHGTIRLLQNEAAKQAENMSDSEE